MDVRGTERAWNKPLLLIWRLTPQYEGTGGRLVQGELQLPSLGCTSPRPTQVQTWHQQLETHKALRKPGHDGCSLREMR